MKRQSDYNEELYAEMLEDEGIKYDPELYMETAEYYFQ